MNTFRSQEGFRFITLWTRDPIFGFEKLFVEQKSIENEFEENILCVDPCDVAINIAGYISL